MLSKLDSIKLSFPKSSKRSSLKVYQKYPISAQFAKTSSMSMKMSLNSIAMIFFIPSAFSLGLKKLKIALIAEKSRLDKKLHLHLLTAES